MPQICYLYRHFSATDELLYVGATCRPIHRTYQHRQSADWYASIARVEIEAFRDRQEALDAERAAIEREKPLWNVRHSTRQPQRHRLRVINHGPCYSIGRIYISKGMSCQRMKANVLALLRGYAFFFFRDVQVEDLFGYLAAAAVPKAAPILTKNRPLIIAKATLPR